MHPVVLTKGRKLKLFQINDPLKQWWSLDELRYCSKCEHLFIGREINVYQDDSLVYHFRCPTLKCEGGFADWEYPDLHL